MKIDPKKIFFLQNLDLTIFQIGTFNNGQKIIFILGKGIWDEHEKPDDWT